MSLYHRCIRWAVVILAGASFCGRSARADISARVAACPELGCHIHLEPGKTYVETKPWNLRGKKHLSITGNGATVAFDFGSGDPPPVAVDASGATNLHFEGWRLTLRSSSGRPDVGLLLARGTENNSAGGHYFERWGIQGWYRKAAVVALASEVNVWTHCFISNSHPNAIAYWTGRDNELAVRSQFGGFGVGSTNTCHDFLATSFAHYGMVNGDNLDGATIAIGSGTHDFHLRGGTMSLRGREKLGAVGGRCAIHLGPVGGKPVVNVLLDAVEWETVGARNAVLVSGQVEGLTIRSALLESTEAVIRVENSGALYDSTVEGNRLIGGIGTYDVARDDAAVIVVQGIVETCRLDLRSRRLIPLGRDIPGRCPVGLFVSPSATFKNNEVHFRRTADIVDFDRIRQANITKQWGQ